jgi:hypothetical protein
MPTPRTSRPSTLTTRTLPLAVAALLTLGLSACGGNAPAAQEPNDAVTPAAAPSAVDPAGSDDATTDSGNGSDVVGRKFDLGTIDKLEDRDGVPVAVLDRFTAKGVPDTDIAEHGLAIKPFTTPPFENLGRTLFRIPVSPEATFVYHHCVAPDQPVQSQSSDLHQMSSLGEPEDIVVVTLDEEGVMTHAENEPGC